MTRLHLVKCSDEKELIVIEGETEVLVVLETFAGDVLVQYGCVQVVSMLLAQELRLAERPIEPGQARKSVKGLLTALRQECQREDSDALYSTDTLAFILRTLHGHTSSQ